MSAMRATLSATRLRLAAGAAAVATTAIAPVQQSFAAVAGNDMLSKNPAVLAAGGNNTFFVFSQETAPIAAGPNQLTNETVTFRKPDGTLAMVQFPLFSSITRANPAGVIISITPAPPALPRNSGVTFRTFPTPKPTAPNITDTALSESGNLTDGTATYTVANKMLSASGFVSPRVTGQGAGIVYDPIQLSSSISGYQYTINANLQAGAGGDGAVEYFAVDSRLTDPSTFIERGQPISDALWALTIVEPGAVASPSDLLVDFEINPLALSEGILSAPGGLDPTAIENSIRNAFVPAGDGATLTGFNLFRANTTYSIDQPITYAAGVSAEVSAVPEPPSATLLGIGALGLIAFASVRNRGVAGR
jgi:hypothetical protein